MRYHRSYLAGFCAVCALFPAVSLAWNPNEGAGYLPPSRYNPAARQAPLYPERQFAPTVQPVASLPDTPPHATTPFAPVSLAAAPAAEAAPAYTAPVATASRHIPVENPSHAVAAQATPLTYPTAAATVEPLPAYAEPIAAAPAATAPHIDPLPPMRPLPEPEKTHEWRGSVGGTYYADTYKENSVSLETNTDYSGLSASIGYYDKRGPFTQLETSIATGEAEYSSISGTADGIREWEYDTRLLFGIEDARRQQHAWTYYFGLGNRYYNQELKGVTTSLGSVGYDRRIFQLYVPLGTKYSYFTDSGWSFTPGFEFDYLFYGNVSSRLRGTGLGLENVENRQKEGFGLRADFMVGMDPRTTGGTGFAFGPFVRYWKVDDSESETDSLGNSWIEPKNSRLQIGAEAKLLF